MSFKAKTYESGRFDALITIKRKTKTQNEFGEEVVALVTFSEAWAEREYQQAREFRAGTSGVEASKKPLTVVKYTLRYVDGISYDMVIIDGNNQYDITGIAEKNRRQYSEIIAQCYV